MSKRGLVGLCSVWIMFLLTITFAVLYPQIAFITLATINILAGVCGFSYFIYKIFE